MERQFKGSSFITSDNETIKVDYYLIVDNKLYFDDKIPRNTYGIEIIENDNEKEIVNDISTDEDFITNIIEKLKTNAVLPVHLFDIIEDLL